MSLSRLSQAARLDKLLELSELLLKTGKAGAFVAENQEFIPTVLPSDFIALFDRIVLDGHTMEEIKILTNKLLNIFHSTIRQHSSPELASGSFLALLEANSRQMDALLDRIRPVFKSFVKARGNAELRQELRRLFSDLELFVQHYTLKENVLFPLLEEHWPDYRCVQIMWSFHDDIRRNIKTVLAQLSEDRVELTSFNRCVGDIFFNMRAIKFREEKILFPHILSTIPGDRLDRLNEAAAELGFPYVQAEFRPAGATSSGKTDKAEQSAVKAAAEGAKPVGTQSDAGGSSPAESSALVNLGTGSLSVEQIKQLFNHLPVDITFVDQFNKVRYFSTPKNRIFPRTIAVLGRDVTNCHPPESMHVVEKIVESFRQGEKDQAAFWIKKQAEMVYIQYFAVRNEQREYLGVLEVSQEVSEIQALQDEKRLLDW